MTPASRQGSLAEDSLGALVVGERSEKKPAGPFWARAMGAMEAVAEAMNLRRENGFFTRVVPSNRTVRS